MTDQTQTIQWEGVPVTGTLPQPEVGDTLTGEHPLMPVGSLVKGNDGNVWAARESNRWERTDMVFSSVTVLVSQGVLLKNALEPEVLRVGEK